MMTTLSEVKAQARGRWPSILSTLGVPARVTNKRNQSCPVCKGGRDRFRFTNHADSGASICTHCGNIGPIDLIMAVNEWDLIKTKDAVERVLGIAQYRPEHKMPRERRSALLNDLWRGAHPIRATDPAALYLKRRCGLTDFPEVLRAHPDMVYTADPESGLSNSHHPGLIAMVHAYDGTPQTIHRTYLTADGQKAAVPSPRRLMPGGFEPGSAVRLTPPARILGVAEGIETAFSATALTGIPCWALIDAHNMSQFRCPADVQKVVVFADNDEKFAGQAGAYTLAKKLAGKDVPVEVRIPEKVKTDWNDVWRMR